jgi:hypothetical protein
VITRSLAGRQSLGASYFVVLGLSRLPSRSTLDLLAQRSKIFNSTTAACLIGLANSNPPPWGLDRNDRFRSMSA